MLFFSPLLLEEEEEEEEEEAVERNRIREKEDLSYALLLCVCIEDPRHLFTPLEREGERERERMLQSVSVGAIQ